MRLRLEVRLCRKLRRLESRFLFHPSGLFRSSTQSLSIGSSGSSGSCGGLPFSSSAADVCVFHPSERVKIHTLSRAEAKFTRAILF